MLQSRDRLCCGSRDRLCCGCLEVQQCCRSGGPVIYELKVGDAAVLRV
jgi:hypothetical protein